MNREIIVNENYYTCHTKVKQIIKFNKPKKSPGIDNINNIQLKGLPDSGVKYLTVLINSCLKLCYFPSSWKVAKVIPIAKPGKPYDSPLSYRPISLLNSLSKILEKIIKEKLQVLIDDLNIYPDYQFGFRPGHSTSHQIARIKSSIVQKFGEKKSTGMVLLDIEKAFDTVWHNALIFKLAKFNVPVQIIKLIKSFLGSRKFAVHLGNTKSPLHEVPAGVPQGSVLGPILFNIYLSDLPVPNPSVCLAMFADDTALFASGFLFQNVFADLQEAIVLLEKYFHKWKIKINATKTQATWFTRRRKSCFLPTTKLQICAKEIEWSDSCKYLGVFLDKKLTFKTHISSTINKVNVTTRILYPFINKNSSLSMQNKLIIFKTIFQPILIYGAPIWFDCAHSHIQKLQVCQNKILKMMLGLPWHYSTNRLHDKANANTIKILINILQEKFFLNCPFSENELIRQITNQNNYQN